MNHTDALLITEYMMSDKDHDAVVIPTTERLDGAIFRAYHMYNMALQLVLDCLYACGLKDFEVGVRNIFQ